MGGGNSKVSYSDNSQQINQSLSNIRIQINELNKDIGEFKSDIDKHVSTVQRQFNLVDNKILSIQNEFAQSFGWIESGIKMIGHDINQMSRLQIEYEQSNSKEHWEIFRNDWKENFERNIFQEFQRLKNLKFELELNLNNKIIGYLLIKDHFNQQIILYQEKKNSYQMGILQKQMNLIMSNLSINLDTSFITNSSTTSSNKMIQFESENTVDISEFVQLNKSIGQIPVLDEEISQLFAQVDRFEEIVRLENGLREKVANAITNFSNPNLSNPLDDVCIGSKDFALKLFDSGITTTNQISYSNQNNLLISNGYSYIPEYKYNDLIKKFIQGCEESNLKLNWTVENINWVSKYLYSKSQFKSISSMIEYSKTSECIYPIELDERDLNKMGQKGLKLYNGLRLMGESNLLELEYETNPIILYYIIKDKNITDLNLITCEIITSWGYKTPNYFILPVLFQILLQLDIDEQIGYKIFSNGFDEIEENKNKFTNCELGTNINSQLVNWIVSKYIETKKLGKLGKFQFDAINVQIASEFFTNIVVVLLKKYMENILDQFNENKLIQINFDSNTLLNRIQIDNPIVKRVLTFNKFADIKIFICFVLSQIHYFAWNKI
jgi:hypothetical protein